MAFNKKFRAGSFCSYKASKRGYYEVSGLFRVSNGKTSKSEDLIAYTMPTLTSTNVSPCHILTFSEGMLPDYSMLAHQVYWLARAGITYLAFTGNNHAATYSSGVLDNVDDNRRAVYYNVFIKDGKPLLSTSENVADALYCGVFRMPSHTPYRLYKINCVTQWAQFAGANINAVSITSGYIDSLSKLPDQDINPYECDIILKVKTGSSVSGTQKLLSFGGFWFGIKDGKFAFARISTVVDSATADTNKTYWVRIMQTGSDVFNYALLYLEDNGSYTIDTLPGVGQWQIGAYTQFIDCAAHDNALRFSDMTNPWGGTIDLLNCRAHVKYIDALSWEEVWHAIDVIN